MVAAAVSVATEVTADRAAAVALPGLQPLTLRFHHQQAAALDCSPLAQAAVLGATVDRAAKREAAQVVVALSR